MLITINFEALTHILLNRVFFKKNKAFVLLRLDERYYTLEIH